MILARMTTKDCSIEQFLNFFLILKRLLMAREKIITSMITIGQNIFYQEFVANRSLWLFE